ncbi:MAG: ATP-binding cassette domain-containing protein [Nitrospiraceae bacterium]|nr:ATP-binding cassette domain-containing protein [Nitrospiraceae bacterium]
MPAIISVEGLTKRYGRGITAVDGVSFQVEEKTIFGFLGPNGAGKTTTINILCTLLSPTSGRALVNGYDCKTEPRMVRSSIGIVFQDTTLDKDLTAYENLVFHAYIYGVRRAQIKPRVEEALRFMGLFDRKDDLVKRFSGGMKRRLEVARGLIHRPRVLFLDEPTLGLDPQSRSHLWEAIVLLPREHGMTVFMTTHYMEEAEVCDRIAIIDGGRIIASGSPEELKRSMGGDVIFLKTTDNALAGRKLAAALGVQPAEKEGELFFEAPRADEQVPAVIRVLSDMVLSLRLQKPTLNDVFLKLTGRRIRLEDVQGGDTIKEEVRAYRRRH